MDVPGIPKEIIAYRNVRLNVADPDIKASVLGLVVEISPPIIFDPPTIELCGLYFYHNGWLYLISTAYFDTSGILGWISSVIPVRANDHLAKAIEQEVQKCL